MKIEAGKSYRTRDGKKATIYTTDARGHFSIHGSVPYIDENELTEDMQVSWNPVGFNEDEDAPNGFDLIAPWTDVPTMDVTVLPRWATHVWFGGAWWYYESENSRFEIPTKYAPEETVAAGSRYRIDWDNKVLVSEEGGAK